MRFCELHDDNKEVKKIRIEGLSERWKNIEKIFYYWGLLYIPQIICFTLVNRHHNNLLAGHFEIVD